jgi:hypothetical protein
MGSTRILSRSLAESARGFFEDGLLPLGSAKESNGRFEMLCAIAAGFMRFVNGGRGEEKRRRILK